MNNPDIMNKKLNEQRKVLFNTMKNGSPEEQQEALNGVFASIENSVLEKAQAEINSKTTQDSDSKILASRGVRRALTSKEFNYFNAAVEKKSFDGLEETMPETIVEEVMKNLHREHELIKHIDVRDTASLAKYIFAKPTKAVAFWGDICDDIRQMILDGFQIIDAVSNKLSGFVPLCKGMAELGPEWLATYVIECMFEAMSVSLEMAIIKGDGKQSPIGMSMALTGAIDGVHKPKEKIEMAALTPKEFGFVMAKFARNEVLTGEMLFIVNPATYWEIIFPAFADKNSNAEWVLDRLPIGAKIVKSYACDEGVAIMGVGKNYFLGVAGKTRIDKYDQTLAIEDLDLYIAKFYGYGQPKDGNAFEVLDISKVGEVVPPVESKAKK